MNELHHTNAGEERQSSWLLPYAQLLLRLVLIIAIVASTFTLFASDKGIVQNYLLEQEIAQVEEKIASQKTQNEQLAQVLTSLREDMDIVEYIARHELRLIGPNEVLFELPPRQADAP